MGVSHARGVGLEGPRQKERKMARTERPSWEQLEEWASNGECEATDGCMVEPDGICPHGNESWMLELGLI